MRKVFRRSLAVFSVAAVVLGTSSFAQAKDYDVTVSTEVRTADLYDNGVKIHKEAVLQTQAEVMMPEFGLFGGVFHSVGIEDDNLPDNEAELDIYLGWTGNVHDLTTTLRVAYIDFVELFDYTENDYVELDGFVEKTFNLGGIDLTPYLGYEYYISCNNNSESGGFTRVGVTHSWDMFPKTRMDQKIDIAHDDGVFGLDHGFIGMYDVKVTHAVTDNLSVYALGKATTPLQSLDDDRETELVGGVGLSYSF